MGQANGTFVGATTENFPTRNMHLALLNQRDKQWLFVPPYSRTEFETVLDHYRNRSWVVLGPHLLSHSRCSLFGLSLDDNILIVSLDVSQMMREYIYQLSSGFGRDVWKHTMLL
jgi:hypothetical protein